MTSRQSQPYRSGSDDLEQYKDQTDTTNAKSLFALEDKIVARTETDLSSDESQFKPNKVYYIQSHNMSSKKIAIVEITGRIEVNFVDGKNVSQEFRDAAKKLGTSRDAVPAFTLRKKHWYNKSYTAFAGSDAKTPLAEWKHPLWSTGTATLGFNADSPHCSHNISIAPVRLTYRRNEFVVNSVPMVWKCDDKYKSNRMTLSKRVAGRHSTVARYTQKWAAWSMGGVVLLDDREVDDLVTILTACTMLRRVEQRRWERYASTSSKNMGAN